MLRSFVTALFCFIATLGARSVAADPIELMSLWESPAKADPTSAWPNGLRVVIYDDGQVLKLVRAATASTEAEIVMGHVSPQGAQERAARTSALLSDMPRPENIKADFPERRWTVFQVWDAAKQDHVKWAVAGHPCAGMDGSAPVGLDLQVRAQLDERFRDACDMLANTLVSDPVDWSPEIIRIDLREAEEAAGPGAPWPTDWSEETRWGGTLLVCINRQAVAQDLTRKLVSSSKSDQQTALGMLIDSPDGKTWRISGVRYALPGPIFHVDRGSDYVNTGTVAEGSCRHR